MRLEWIDDILAVLDSGSLARAAERRLLTQSAFTRRVRLIEDHVGVTLFDRRRKPVTLMPGVQALEPELRDLSARLHDLRQTLKTANDQGGKSLTFVCQHALTTTVSPRVVRALTENGDVSVRVRSGNQDECLLQLISKEADFAIMYAVPQDRMSDLGGAFDLRTLGADVLIPVCAPAMRQRATEALIPTINYPPDVFLGQVVARTIFPRLRDGVAALPVTETALTLAVLQYAVNEIGIAWLPHSICRDALEQAKIVRIDNILPSQALNVRLVRLAGGQSDFKERIWKQLNAHPEFFTAPDKSHGTIEPDK